MSNDSTISASPATSGSLWRQGFLVMLRRELSKWWFSRKLLIGVILWTFLINVIGLAGVVTVNNADSNTQTTAQGLVLLFTLWTSLPMLGAAFTLPGILSDERKSGIMSWLLSKPVFRSAFYLAKLSANALMGFLIIVLLQGTIAYGRLAAQGAAPNLLNFIAGMLLVGLILLFYQALTTMLDTVFSNRAVAIAIPVAVLMTGAILPAVSPLLNPWMRNIALFLFRILPWGLGSGSLTGLVAGQPLPEVTPILGTALFIVVFTAIGIWRFRYQEI